METGTWILVGAVALIAIAFKIAERWDRAKLSFERTVFSKRDIVSPSLPNRSEAAMQDRSKEFDQLVGLLQQALTIASALEQNTLTFLIDRAIDEARAQAVPMLSADRLQ